LLSIHISIYYIQLGWALAVVCILVGFNS